MNLGMCAFMHITMVTHTSITGKIFSDIVGKTVGHGGCRIQVTRGTTSP